MKLPAALGILLLWFPATAAQAQQGLKGEYYTGTNFERKVFTRIDPAISFSWFNRSPALGLPKSYYSIRWTGKLLAPATGQYTFSARVDDGIRVWIGNRKIMDSWQLNNSKGIEASIGLEAGHYYDLRVDYFNDMLEGEIELYWQRPDVKKPLFSFSKNTGEPITAQFFVQKAAPVAAIPKPTPAVPVVRPVSNRPKEAIPKPVPALPVAKKQATPPKPVVDTVVKAVVSAPTPLINPFDVHKAGETVVLRHVQFEQSSYILLPESLAELDHLATALKANPLWHIDIAGHTDNVGDPRLNLALSENRAKVVSTYLTRHGIAGDRLTATGYGGTRPIADNVIDSERPKNRRVEITIR